MLEIYNESIRDLLSDDQGGSAKLDILSTQPSGLNVPGAMQIAVANTADVVAMMRVGARNRHSAETKMNERSSRSHQVLTIIVDGCNLATGARTHACLHLVDLAGSERTDKSGVEGQSVTECVKEEQLLLRAEGPPADKIYYQLPSCTWRSRAAAEPNPGQTLYADGTSNITSA